MSTDLTDEEIRVAAGLLSRERLFAFVRIAGTERDAIVLHHHTLRVAAALMPLTAMIEIVLRNAICERLRQTFGNPDWLTNPPLPFAWKGDEAEHIRKAQGWARRAEYANLSHTQKRDLDAMAFPGGIPRLSHEQISKARQKVIQITNGQLIAQLTLFFWKRLFSADYEATLWKRSLRKLFPNKTLSRADVARHLETLYQTRNRIAHHEPVMGHRLVAVIAATEFMALNFSCTSPSDKGILARMTASYRLELATEANAFDVALTQFTVKP